MIGSTAAQFGFAPIGDAARETERLASGNAQHQVLKLKVYEIIKMARKAEAPLPPSLKAQDDEATEEVA